MLTANLRYKPKFAVILAIYFFIELRPLISQFSCHIFYFIFYEFNIWSSSLFLLCLVLFIYNTFYAFLVFNTFIYQSFCLRKQIRKRGCFASSPFFKYIRKGEPSKVEKSNHQNEKGIKISYLQSYLYFLFASTLLNYCLKMNSPHDQNSTIVTQEPTPNSSHIFLTPIRSITTPPSLKLDRCICTCQTSRPTTPRGQNSSQIVNQKLSERDQIRLSHRFRQSQKHQSGMWTADSSRHNDQRRQQPIFNMKQTLREYEQQIKELRKWFGVLRKQCNIYEETIAKMDQKITGLQQQNKALVAHLKAVQQEKQNMEKTHKIQAIELTLAMETKQATNKEQIKELKEKVNSIMKMYGELESEVNRSDVQWAIWKEKWIAEKRCYVNKIEQLKEYLNDSKNCALLSARPRSTQQDCKKNQYRKFYDDLMSRKNNNKSSNNSPNNRNYLRR